MHEIDRMVVPFLLAFFVGIGIHPIFEAGLATNLYLSCFATLLLLWYTSSRRYIALLLFAIFAGIILGFWRMLLVPPVTHFKEGVWEGKVMIVEEPELRERYTRYVAEVVGNSSVDRIMLGLPRYPEYHYGDELYLRGKLQYPEDFESGAGRIFQYDRYLHSTKNVSMVMYYPKVELMDTGVGNTLQSALLSLKNKFLDQAKRQYGEPEQSLLSGMVFGGKASLGEEWVERFRASGLVHIIVLSGYNMTLVAVWILKLTSIFGFRLSLLGSCFGLIAYAVMAGGGATVLRALIMSLIALLARATGKTYQMTRALLLAGFFMLLHQPEILLADPSFQLSFLATLGLIYLTPIVEWVCGIEKKTVFTEIVAATIATQLAVLPLLLYLTGVFSLLALPANLLVLPLIPIAMMGGVVSILFGLLYLPLGLIVSIPTQLILSWVLMVAKTVSGIEIAIVHVDVFSVWVLVCCYLALVTCVIFFHRRQQAR